MGCLSLAMKPHWSQVCRRSQLDEPIAMRLRFFGVAGLLASLAACLGADHPSMACLVWVMTMSASALSVAMTLSYAPRALYWLAAVTGSVRDFQDT